MCLRTVQCAAGAGIEVLEDGGGRGCAVHEDGGAQVPAGGGGPWRRTAQVDARDLQTDRTRAPNHCKVVCIILNR